MSRTRPLAVKLIAVYLCLKATALILAVYIAHTRPDLRPDANEFFKYFSINIGVTLPYPAALLNLSVGLGIWFQQRWSRTVTVLINSYYFFKLVVGSLILKALGQESLLLSKTISPYFAISSLASLLILCYLLDPRVKREFGERD